MATRSKYDTPAGTVALGGIDLVDLSGEHPRPEHQIPMKAYVDDRREVTLETWAPRDPELVVSNNGYWAEPIENGEPVGLGKKLMRFYFMAERDNQTDLMKTPRSKLRGIKRKWTLNSLRKRSKLRGIHPQRLNYEAATLFLPAEN